VEQTLRTFEVSIDMTKEMIYDVLGAASIVLLPVLLMLLSELF
jgi:hypothetical protein